MLLRLALMVSIVLASVSSKASAQGMNLSSPQYFLLMSKSIQQELKMTDEQVRKVLATIEKLMPENSTFKFENGGKMGAIKLGTGGDGGAVSDAKVSFSVVVAAPKGAGGEGGPVIMGGPVNLDPSNLRMPGLPDFKKIDEEVMKILEEPQRDRLQQIHLQSQGLTALAQDKYATQAGLLGEQRELIKQILDENRKATMELFSQMRGEGGMSSQKISEHMKKQREGTENDIALLLSEEQKEKWEEMIGPKFEFKIKK